MNTINTLANNPFANSQNSLIYGENAIPVEQSANGLGYQNSALLFDDYGYGFSYPSDTGLGYDSMMIDPMMMGGGMIDPMMMGGGMIDPMMMGGGMLDIPMLDPTLLGGGIGGGNLLGGSGIGVDPLIGGVHNPNHFQDRMDQLDREYYEQQQLIWGDS